MCKKTNKKNPNLNYNVLLCGKDATQSRAHWILGVLVYGEGKVWIKATQVRCCSEARVVDAVLSRMAAREEISLSLHCHSDSLLASGNELPGTKICKFNSALMETRRYFGEKRNQENQMF